MPITIEINDCQKCNNAPESWKWTERSSWAWVIECPNCKKPTIALSLDDAITKWNESSRGSNAGI